MDSPRYVVWTICRWCRQRLGGRHAPDDDRRGQDAAQKSKRDQQNDEDDRARPIPVPVAAALPAAEELAQAGEGAAHVPPGGVGVVDAGVSIPRRRSVVEETAAPEGLCPRVQGDGIAGE